MIEFITTTLSFTVAILLASSLTCALLFSKPVIRWYAKHAVKYMKDFQDTLESEIEKEL